MFKSICNYLHRFWLRLFKSKAETVKTVEPIVVEPVASAHTVAEYVARNERGRVPKVLRRIRTMQGKSTGDYQ